MSTKRSLFRSSAVIALFTAAVSPALPDDLISTRKLSAALAMEAVTEAVASCEKKGFPVSAAVLNIDGRVQATLRGNGSAQTAYELAGDKAYTAVMLGATRNEDSTREIIDRMAATPTSWIGYANVGGLGKLPNVSLLRGGLRIKIGNEIIGGIGVGGAPTVDDDEACARAALDKIGSRLK